MALEGDDGVAGKEGVLACLPCDWGVPDCHAGGLVGKRFEFCFASPGAGVVALLPLFGVANSQVGVQRSDGSSYAVEEVNGNWCPEPTMVGIWCM